MPDKLEVLQGPRLVARFGEMALWAGPQASAALQVHLVSEAQRVSQGSFGGDQVANSLVAVLQRGDPEPHVPFVVVGPGTNGLVLFLHGPVQAWDSGRWLAPQPVPGWLATTISRPWPLIILPYGAPPPPQSQQGNPFDLVAGVVPGGGFVLLRPMAGPVPQAAPPQVAATAQPPQTGYGPTGGGPGMGGPGMGGPGMGGPGMGGPGMGGPGMGGPGMGGPGMGGPGMGGPGMGGPAMGGPAMGGPLAGAAPLAGSPPPSGPVTGAPLASGPVIGAPERGPTPSFSQGPQSPPGAGGPASGGVGTAPPSLAAPPVPSVLQAAPQMRADGDAIDLRAVPSPGRLPLAMASALSSSYSADRPDAVGVRCEQGHLNHPRVLNCLRCGRPIPAGSAQQSGPRPPIGILLADDGSIWALDRGYLVGADPTTAPEVQSGAARAISMRAGPNRPMAPVQAEIQARGWSAYVVDRGAPGGSHLQGAAAPGWEQLGRGEQREVTNGSHISFGGRVLTYLSAWPS